MSEQHTPEPWAAGKNTCEIVDDLQHHVAATWDSLEPREVDLANARRIVAAVNACQGIPTETLERLGLGGLARVVEALEEYADEDYWGHTRDPDRPHVVYIDQFLGSHHGYDLARKALGREERSQ